MTPEDIERVDEALRYGGVEELRAEVRAALERANDVGALDAWEDARPGRRVDVGRFPAVGWVAELYEFDGVKSYNFHGANRDAARAAAAKAIEAGEVG